MEVPDLEIEENFNLWAGVIRLKANGQAITVLLLPPEKLREWGQAFLNAAQAFDAEKPR